MLKLADLRVVDLLVEQCRDSQGEFLDAWHLRTSWATRYSNKFVQATVELYALYSARGYSDPEQEVLLAMLEGDVQACRGGTMNAKALRYLMVEYKINERAASLNAKK